jgi:O-antigen ligase
VARARHAWDTFKSQRGYAANASGSRLTSGLGSQRYDFYRVALDEFLAHPLVGIGADNFQQQYLAHGHSEETPHYPHSVELRTLVQTGVIGALLALVGLAAALVAAARGTGHPEPSRSPPPSVTSGRSRSNYLSAAAATAG